MNPLIIELVGGFVRWLLTFGSGYLVSRGIWTTDQAEHYVVEITAAVATALAALLWTVWQKYHNRVKIVTALAKSQMTEQDLEEQIAAGVSAPATTPKDARPKAKASTKAAR